MNNTRIYIVIKRMSEELYGRNLVMNNELNSNIVVFIISLIKVFVRQLLHQCNSILDQFKYIAYI